MTITVTIDDLNIPESMKTDPGVIAEVTKIIDDVTSLAFVNLPFGIDDDVHEDVEAAMNRIIRIESETRFYRRNQPDSDAPPHGAFYSSDAYFIWNQYYDRWPVR
jgi:hypothetical protein